ncbi:N-acetylglucosamine-6-phosphate deacetylase [bacterium]|nr:N-acetylglucosamine-6-phosphate deacetylase [bacterium]
MKITKGLIEQHIHGAFGIDFMNCNVLDVVYCSQLLLKNGVCAFFPTIMTDDINKIKERIAVVKEAQSKQDEKMAQIIGVHLEGPFISPNKAGIHEKKYILPLDIDLYKQIEDDIIKIVTIAPELDKTGEFQNYLLSKGVKLAAGHCETDDLSKVSQVTHLYNAMTSFHHRIPSTVASALSNNNVYVEIIADSMHVNDEVLKITFKQKSLDKIILVSDALPMAHSKETEGFFAGQKIYNKNEKLVNAQGTMAGSSMLLCDIIKNLVDKNIMTFENAIQCASSNIEKYHNINNTLKVYWSDFNRIEKTELG